MECFYVCVSIIMCKWSFLTESSLCVCVSVRATSPQPLRLVWSVLFYVFVSICEIGPPSLGLLSVIIGILCETSPPSLGLVYCECVYVREKVYMYMCAFGPPLIEPCA